MLARSNDMQLIQKKNINKKFIFFYQRWQEMLESRTLDMYQYNILNSYVACQELEDVIEKTLSGLFTSRQNIDDCKLETLEIVRADNVLEKHNHALRTMLLRILSSKIEGKSHEETIIEKSGAYYSSLNRLKYQLMTPIRQLSDNYLSYIMDSLKESIDVADYLEIEKCSSCLISQCLFGGWSTKGLLQLINCFVGDNSEARKWECFRNRIIAYPQNSLIIYYSIKLETKTGLCAETIREIIRSLDLDVYTGKAIIGSSDDPILCSKLSPGTTYIKQQIEATDIYAGVLSVINSLNSKLSIATFYNIFSPLIANAPQIIVYDMSSKTVSNLQLADIFKTYDYIDSNNDIFNETKQIFSDLDKKEIATKIGAAFAYTSLSRSASFQETKYLSLWIALESLMRTGQYGDIISHIKCVLPEIMCTRYIYHIVRNFAEDCLRCGFETEMSLGLDMQSSDKNALVKQLISIFRDNALFGVLQQNCACNSLLQYRCNELHSLLNDPNELIGKLDHYTQKIRWHVQRLYRIRNEITHSAFKQNRSLIIYIEHLYSYLAQIISEIVRYIKSKKVSSVEEALAVLKENYSTFYELLKQGNLSNNEVLPNGIVEIV